MRQARFFDTLLLTLAVPCFVGYPVFLVRFSRSLVMSLWRESVQVPMLDLLDLTVVLQVVTLL